MVKSGKPGILRLIYFKRRGIAYIWVAAVFLILALLVGLVLDVSRIFYVAHQLHNAADAAALAGARVVKIDQDEARLTCYKYCIFKLCRRAKCTTYNQRRKPAGRGYCCWSL